jgi:hypothetical protein
MFCLLPYELMRKEAHLEEDITWKKNISQCIRVSQREKQTVSSVIEICEFSFVREEYVRLPAAMTLAFSAMSEACKNRLKT